MHTVLGYIRGAFVTSERQDYYHSIMSLPSGTYNIINVTTGNYANLSQAVVAPFTPIIAWASSGTGGDNEKVTFALLYHVVVLIFDLLSVVGGDVPGIRSLHYPKWLGRECICWW